MRRTQVEEEAQTNKSIDRDIWASIEFSRNFSIAFKNVLPTNFEPDWFKFKPGIWNLQLCQLFDLDGEIEVLILKPFGMDKLHWLELVKPSLLLSVNS